MSNIIETLSRYNEVCSLQSEKPNTHIVKVLKKEEALSKKYVYNIF